MAQKKKSKPAAKKSDTRPPRKPALASKKKSPVEKKKPSSKPSPQKPAPRAAEKSPPVKAAASPAKLAAPPAKPEAKPKTKAATAPAEAKAAVGAKSAKSATADLRRRILERKTSKPIVFTLDEVREIAKTNTGKSPAPEAAEKKPRAAQAAKVELVAKPAKPHHVKPASLADILGFNPSKGDKPANLEDRDVPEKFKRYYKLLIDLRNHVVEGLDMHTEDTLKRSSKEDSGDLSSYGQHMADAGTDTFDRDFALSLVSSEQEALTEIDAAIKRIHDGKYGICELTGKPINKERLLAVPFARYSVESQAEMERTNRRSSQRGGFFLGEGEEGKMMDDEGGGGGGGGGDE